MARTVISFDAYVPSNLGGDDVLAAIVRDLANVGEVKLASQREVHPGIVNVRVSLSHPPEVSAQHLVQRVGPALQGTGVDSSSVWAKPHGKPVVRG